MSKENKKDTDKCNLHCAISRFIFDEAEKVGLQPNEINVTIEANYKSDRYVDIIISDDDWNELSKYKTENGL